MKIFQCAPGNSSFPPKGSLWKGTKQENMEMDAHTQPVCDLPGSGSLGSEAAPVSETYIMLTSCCTITPKSCTPCRAICCANRLFRWPASWNSCTHRLHYKLKKNTKKKKTLKRFKRTLFFQFDSTWLNENFQGISSFSLCQATNITIMCLAWRRDSLIPFCPALSNFEKGSF